MSHAESCPVCCGEGKTQARTYGDPPKKVTCHGCNGRGWVEVQDNETCIPVIPTVTIPGSNYQFLNSDDGYSLDDGISLG